MNIWMMVTRDKYELPLAVADTARELSEITGYGIGSILNGAHGIKTGRYKSSMFRNVKVDDTDE